jgi:hypothetical protein
MQHSRHAGIDRVARALPVAAPKDVRLARVTALLERERRGRIDPVRERVVDLLVHLSEPRIVVTKNVEQLAPLLA